MKKFATMLVAVALLALPTTVMADATVWFELGAGSSDDIMAVGGGQEGSVLELNKATLDGPSTLELVMFTNVTGVSLYSVSTTLAAQGDQAAAYTGASYVGIPPDGGASTPPGSTGSGPGSLFSDFGAGTFSGPGYLGVTELGSLTIDISKDGAMDGDVTELTAQIGVLLWAQSNFQPAQVSFAGGQFVNGGTAGAGGDVVVRITNIIPEPATLSLLGFGAVALLRRRR